jgi:hypothetical protein
MEMHGQPHLLEVIGALHAAGGFSNGLDGRQQQSNKGADDGDDHQQLD